MTERDAAREVLKALISWDSRIALGEPLTWLRGVAELDDDDDFIAEIQARAEMRAAAVRVEKERLAFLADFLGLPPEEEGG